jgi:glucose dehydrogenase
MRFAALLSIMTVSALLASSAQQRNAATSVNWPLHNLDLAGSRFSTLDQISTSNVTSLTPRWLFQHGVIDGVSNQTTPVIVDGRCM